MRKQATAPKTGKLLTPADLADMCGVPIASVYGWNSDGTGPHFVRVGRHVRYRVQDVDLWLDRNTNKPWRTGKR